MDITTKNKNVNNNIIELIKSDDEKWNIQRDKLIVNIIITTSYRTIKKF